MRTRRQPKVVVMGLDLSLRKAAACIIPDGWTYGRAELETTTVGYELEGIAPEYEQMERLKCISEWLMKFAVEHEVTDVFVEQYAFSKMASRAHALGELGGVVKYGFFKAFDVAPIPVVASQARKFLCGKLPAKDAKKVVQAKLVEMGFTFDSDDEGDAFVVANYGLFELGRRALSIQD